MRTTDVIMTDLSSREQTAKLILEVLLDIRDLLTKPSTPAFTPDQIEFLERERLKQTPKE